MKKEKENSHEGITWSEMRKQNIQAKEVYCYNDCATYYKPEAETEKCLPQPY